MVRFRTVVSALCAIAVLAPTAAFAGDRHDRSFDNRGFYNRAAYGRDSSRNVYNRPRVVERVRTIEFSNRNRAVERRNLRSWERRDAARERYWRDRRDDRFRRGYDRDRYNRPSIIIIPRLSF